MVTADRKVKHRKPQNRGVARRTAKLQTPPNLITADRKERVRRVKTGRGYGTVGSGKVCVVAPIVRGRSSTPIRATLG